MSVLNDIIPLWQSVTVGRAHGSALMTGSGIGNQPFAETSAADGSGLGEGEYGYAWSDGDGNGYGEGYGSSFGDGVGRGGGQEWG